MPVFPIGRQRRTNRGLFKIGSNGENYGTVLQPEPCPLKS